MCITIRWSLFHKSFETRIVQCAMLCEGRFVCRDDDMDDAKVSNATYIASLKLNERCCVNSDRREEYVYV